MSTEAFESVKIARDSKRPTGLDYINAMFSEFFELHGDRCFGDDAAIVGGVAYLGRQPVTVIAIEKGHTIKERNARLSGAPHPEGYRKALRLMQQAEKFQRPIICFVDRVWMLEHSVYSVISPEGCASILWKDAKKADEAADNLKLTAQDAYRFGFIEKIISEKDLGSRIFYKDLQKMLIDELKILAQEDDLSESRYRRFRALGAL